MTDLLYTVNKLWFSTGRPTLNILKANSAFEGLGTHLFIKDLDQETAK